MGGVQLTEPEPAGGSTKKEKEKLRKERQRQRKVEEAWEALQVAIELLMGRRCGLRRSMRLAARSWRRWWPRRGS
jgi:hypothetical protein